MNNAPTQNPDPMALSRLCAASLRASGDLIAVMLATLPQTKHDALQALLDGGGSIGIEVTTDRQGTNRIKLIGMEREGARLMLAEISALSSASYCAH